MKILKNNFTLYPNKIFTVSFGNNRKTYGNVSEPVKDTFQRNNIVLKEIRSDEFIEAKPYESQEEYCAEDFFNKLKYENAQCKYITKNITDYKISQEVIDENKEAQQLARQLEKLTLPQQKETVRMYSQQTGFPNLQKVRTNMEKEVVRALHNLAEKENFQIKFIGYDKNCSLGRTLALPGSDIDALYMIIDYKNKPDWFSGAMRWKFKDLVNQRLVNTPAGHLPEILSMSFLNDGLKLASNAFEANNFSQTELEKFRKNLTDSSNNFVKSAEFNIRLAKKLPDDTLTRDKFYKTAMLVELIREGIILENNFSDDFINKVKDSPLYKYSNIMKMQGLSDKPKRKHIDRLNLTKNFNELDKHEQFEIVKSLIYASLNIFDTKYQNLFNNNNSQGQDEMGNILDMYDMLMH